MKLLDLAKSFLHPVRPDAILVDFTMGNGHDTEYLCRLVPDGFVTAFDVQPEALDNTAKRLGESGLSNYRLILSGHETVKEYVKGKIDGGLFNLGYRPGGDKTKHTMRDTTLKAVFDALDLLNEGGVIVISVYPGHPEGRLEGELLIEKLSGLDQKFYSVLSCRMVNSPDSPYCIAIEKYKK